MDLPWFTADCHKMKRKKIKLYKKWKIRNNKNNKNIFKEFQKKYKSFLLKKETKYYQNKGLELNRNSRGL